MNLAEKLEYERSFISADAMSLMGDVEHAFAAWLGEAAFLRAWRCGHRNAQGVIQATADDVLAVVENHPLAVRIKETPPQ